MFWRVTLLAGALQLGMVLLGWALPTLRQQNLYPIIGTLIASCAGLLYARWTPARTTASSLWGGALAGGLSSLLGAGLAVLVAPPPGPASTVLVASLTGWIAGGVSAGLGRLLPRPHPPG